MVDAGELSKCCYSGPLKLFEKGKSCNAWSEYWAVIGLESLRLFTNHESFLNDLAEVKLIRLTAHTICQNVRKTNRVYQFKICNDDGMYSFKCESESSKEHWLRTLGAILSRFCQKSCFHCSEWSENACASVRSGSENADNSSESSSGSLHSRTDESTFISTSTNIPRHSTGSEDQITKSPLKIYDSEQSVFSSFNKAKKARSETEIPRASTDSVKHSQSTPQVGQAMRNEKSTPITKNSFGYTFETGSSADHVSSSSLKLFDRENKRFSTFLKRSSLKREHPIKDFSNPAFVLDDGDFTPECPEIPKRISNVFEAPLNYDVPSLSKNDPSRGYLKVLTGRKNWKKCQAAVEMNILLLSDPEENPRGPENNVTRIELKPNIKFTLLPRRSNDYRFKMASGTSEYFFKSSNVQQRDFWINVLTNATSSVCQNTCPRCCTSATRSAPNWTDSDSNLSSEVDVNESADAGDQNEDTDDVFYVGMAKPNEGLTFVNSVAGESGHDLSASDEATVDFPQADQVDNQKPSYLRCGYLKTNAIENNWGQYWAVIVGKQLVLHSSEDNLNELKTIQLSHNVQCKTARRSSYDFRFTLSACAVESYEFKCASAHDRREWMTSLERSGGGGAQGLNVGSRISEIVTQIRENQSRMEEIMEQKRAEEMKEQRRKEELSKQQEEQQQQQEGIDDSQDIYDDISPDGTILQQLPPVPQQLPPPKQSKNREQHQQQKQQDIDGGQYFSSNLPAHQQLPPIPPRAPPTPPENREQHHQHVEGGQDVYDDTCVQNIPQQNLPPVPQQRPSPTPPQEQQEKRLQQQQTKELPEQQAIQQDLYEIIPAEKDEQHEKQEKQEQPSEQIANEGGQDLYEIIPADNSQQQSQQEELYELIPADQVEQCEQKQAEKNKQKANKNKKEKEKKIVPTLPKKQQKKDKKQRKDKQSPEPDKQQKPKQENNKNQQKQTTQKPSEKQNNDITKHDKVEEKDMNKNLEDKMKEQTQKLSWDFEQPVKSFQDVKSEESSSSAESKEDVGLRLQTENNVGVIEEKSSEFSSPGDETISTDMSSGIQDVERFLSQVLGKLTNLPDDVNKERLELSQRLQKLINLPEKEESKRRPPPPQPVEPVKELDEDEGTYGDVASPSEGQETYDDVVKENTNEVQEDYEDIIGMHQRVENELEPEELYDDVNAPDVATPPKDRSLSKVSNNSEGLDTNNVAEPKKASDVTDKVYEGVLDKYKTKGFMKSLTSKWQRRFCVLTPLALYYYENQKDQKQKGQIFLPSSGTTLRSGCPNFADVKDGKLCFELQCNDRCYLFKVLKESERDIWVRHIEAALQTDLSDEQSKIMKQTSSKISDHDDDDVATGADDEDLYETVDTFKQVSKETSDSGKEGPALPSRTKVPSDEPSVPKADVEEEEFEEIDEVEDYQLPDVNVPKPGSARKEKQEEKPPPVMNRQNQRGSATLPPRPSSSQEAPNLPPRSDKSPADSPKPPELPSRTTPPTQKKAPPELPIRTTPTLTKKTPADEPEPPPPAEEEPEVKPKPEVTPPVKAKPTGEQFDYGKVYVAMWNCQADDEEDLAFSRGNYLYIREKIPNSDWWVASLMDIPDIRVGLVPRNYIMPAYEM